MSPDGGLFFADQKHAEAAARKYREAHRDLVLEMLKHAEQFNDLALYRLVEVELEKTSNVNW